ncbi:MAG: hypothetical protein EBQ92_00485, partial [Proteobacteria bacterium]|nr:hypothetical protein [Pseudomonadota bacterium]
GVDTTNGTAIIITYINEPTVKLAIKSSGYEGEWISQNEAGVVIAESKIDGYLNVDVESNAILQFQGCIFNNDLSSDRTPLSFTGTGTVNFAGGYPNIDNNVENACYPLYNMINAVSEYEVIVNNDANIIFDNNNNTNNFYVNLPAGFVRNEDDTLDTPIFQLTNINFSDKSLVTSATYNFGSTPSGSTQIDVVFPYHPEEESLTATLINTSINSGMNVRFANNYYVSLYNDETQLTENIEGEGNTSEYNIQFQNLTLNVDNSDKILGLNGDGGYTFLSGFINCTLPDVTPIVVNGTCSVLFADGEVTTDGATNQPKYIMQSNTTGNSLITLGNNSLSCSGGVHIYWPTLENVTTSKPLNSKTRQYYAADYEPNVITTVTHGSDGAYSHSQIICRCTPGFEDLGWDDNVGSLLYSESISIGSNTYDSENIFNSNVFDTSYYGSLDGNSTYTRNFLLSSAVVVTTISFANTSSSYLGNASMKLNPTTGTAFVNAFGEGPIFQYDIVENSTLPTLTFVDDILQIINFGQTRKTVRMELSKSLGVELYVYPYLGENTDRLDIAKIFQYKNIDASYVSYDDYIDDANVSKLIKLSIGTESFNFLVNYDYESNRSYAIGKSLYFDLSPLTPTNAGNPTVAFETADGITVENYGPLNYPVISLSSDYDFINNGNIEDGVDNEVDNSGNLNESTENDPLVVTTDDVGQYADSAFSYTKRYYIGMFIKTIGNADHVLTITGTSDGYTYEFASVDSSPVVDNGGNTATMTFDGDDYTLYPVDITITTNGDANLYNIGARENFKIEVSDSAALVGLNDAETIASVPTYLRSEFYFPIVVETRFDSLSWENSGTPTKEIGVNTSVLLSARIVGTANTNMDLVFNMASNNSGFWLYDGSNECKEQLVLTLNSGSGAQTETSKTIHRYDNKYIIGAGSTDDTPTITLTPYTVNNLDFLQSVTALQLNHIASEQLNHIITYDVSLGNSEDLDDGTSS